MKSIIVTAVLVAGAAAASAQQGQDRISKTGSVEVKGRITRASWQAVIYTDAAGKSVTLKGSEVEGIVFWDQPTNYLRAKVAESETKVDKAATLYEEALKEIETRKLRDWNKAPLFLDWADFLSKRGDTDGALAMLKRLRAECGDTWWRPESYRKAIDIARSKGVEAQKTVLEEMKSEPEPLTSEAEIGLAELAATRGEQAEALEIYTKVAGNPSSPQMNTAKLGVFRMLKALDRKSDLESFCRKVLDDPATAPSLQQAAGAWTAGALLEKAGKDKSKLRLAILAAAKAIAMGPPERKEEAVDYVAALKVAAKGFATLAADSSKPEQKQEYQSRASGYLMEIVRAYKGTPWAEAANLELQALGVDQN